MHPGSPKTSIHQQQTTRPLSQSTTLVPKALTASPSIKTNLMLASASERTCHFKANPGTAMAGAKPSDRSLPATSQLQHITGLSLFLPGDTKGPDKFDHNNLQKHPSVKVSRQRLTFTRSCAAGFPSRETELQQRQLRTATVHRLEIRSIF